MISTYNALSEEYYFLSLYILSLLFDVMFVAMPDFRPISVLAFHSCGISRSIPSRSNDTRFQQKHQKYPKINSQNSSKISSKSIVLTIFEVRNLKPFSTESSVDKSHCIKSGRWRTIPQAFSVSCYSQAMYEQKRLRRAQFVGELFDFYDVPRPSTG